MLDLLLQPVLMVKQVHYYSILTTRYISIEIEIRQRKMLMKRKINTGKHLNNQIYVKI
jgi:hypothetical protein